MFIDLKALGGMESHRGIGYIMLVSSIFAPSFLAVALLSPDLVERQMLLGVLLACSVGLICTAGITGAVFMSVTAPDDSAPRERRLGARSLGAGGALSLAAQIVALGLLLRGRIESFGSYVGYVVVFSVMLCSLMFLIGYLEHRKRATKPATE